TWTPIRTLAPRRGCTSCSRTSANGPSPSARLGETAACWSSRSTGSSPARRGTRSITTRRPSPRSPTPLRGRATESSTAAFVAPGAPHDDHRERQGARGTRAREARAGETKREAGKARDPTAPPTNVRTLHADPDRRRQDVDRLDRRRLPFHAVRIHL